MSHYRLPTKMASGTPGRVSAHGPNCECRQRPTPSTADLALMRVVLGLAPGAEIRIATNAEERP